MIPPTINKAPEVLATDSALSYLQFGIKIPVTVPNVLNPPIIYPEIIHISHIFLSLTICLSYFFMSFHPSIAGASAEALGGVGGLSLKKKIQTIESTAPIMAWRSKLSIRCFLNEASYASV